MSYPRFLPAILAASLALTACGVGPTYSIANIRSSCSFPDGARGRIFARVENGIGYIAVSRDGTLLGREALEQIESKFSMHGVREWRDHPKLDQWRRQLADAHALESTNAPAAKLVETLDGLPFTDLCNDVVTRWTGDDPARAATVVDAAVAAKASGDWLQPVIKTAAESGGLDDARLAAWAALAKRNDAREALAAVAHSPNAGPKTLRLVLDAVDDFSGSDRVPVMLAAGKGLLGDPAAAGDIVDGIEDLYGSDRRVVALELLGDPRSTPAFAKAVLENIGDYFGSDRLAIYRAVAPQLYRDAEGQRLLIEELDELFGSDRKKAALDIIRDDAAPPRLVAGYVRTIDDLFGSDRGEVLGAILETPGYGTDPQLQLACVEATKDLFSSDRKRLLATIANHDRTTAEVRRKATNLLAK